MPENQATHGLAKFCGFMLHGTVHCTVHAVPALLGCGLQLAGVAFEKIVNKDQLMCRRGGTLIIESKYDSARRSGRYYEGKDPDKRITPEEAHALQTTVPEEVNALDAFGFEYSRDRQLREVGHSDEVYDGPLYSGNLQTMLAGVVTRPKIGKRIMCYERQTVRAPYDQCSLCFDWRYSTKVKRHAKDKDSGLPNPKGLVVVFPGLSSHSNSNYIQRYVLHAADEGYHVVVINARGMGSCPLDKPLVACGSFTEDIRGVLHEILTPAFLEEKFGRFPRRVPGGRGGNEVVSEELPLPMLGVGFSLGASMMCLYLSQVREATPLHAAIAINAPWNFHDSAAAMGRPFAMWTYQPALLTGLHRTCLRHSKVLLQHPSQQVRDTVQMIVDGYRCSTVKEFDTRFTIAAFDYPNVEAYYSSASSMPHLHKIEIPLMCVASDDDPICGAPPSLRRWTAVCNANPNVLYVSIPSGGHLGFTQNPFSELAGSANFMERRTVQALDMVSGYVYRKHRRDVPDFLEEKHLRSEAFEKGAAGRSGNGKGKSGKGRE